MILPIIRDSLEKVANPNHTEANIIGWASPVLSFGAPISAKVATLGLNPSNREFVDRNNNTLRGNEIRLHTLESLNLTSWHSAQKKDLTKIIEKQFNYFNENPYGQWFNVLESLLTPSGLSYYGKSATLCHLDLSPYATHKKWTNLTSQEEKLLLEMSKNILPRILRESRIETLILNGRKIVKEVEKAGNLALTSQRVADWDLPRRSGRDVPGFSYQGTLHCLFGHELRKPVSVLGYNHNLQSSFGVTKKVKNSISAWISKKL